METIIHGTSLVSPSFQAALHGALRTLINHLGVTTFNVGISGMNTVSSDMAADIQSSISNTADASALLHTSQGITAR